jgi:hypothetical protein
MLTDQQALHSFTLSPNIGRLIQDLYLGQRLTSGPTDISSCDVTSFVVSRFLRNHGRRTSPIDVSTPKSTMFCPKGKKKDTRYAFYNVYTQRIPPYSAFWTENRKRFQKCENGYVACLSSID